MGRFSAPVKPKVGSRPTTNLAGGFAYDRDARTSLASLVLTSMVQDTFYTSANDQLRTLRNLVRSLAQNNDLKFAAQAAIYARKEHGLRSITHALAAEIAQVSGDISQEDRQWLTRFFTRVIFRLDDMSQIASYWVSNYGKGEKKTLPNAMKRGFAPVFEGAPAGLLAKWNGANGDGMSLRQLAHLVHPKGGEGSAVYKLRGGALESADTHEVALTRAGQQTDGNVEEAKAEAWADLFKRGRVKYLAALRNARRILEQAPDCVQALCEKLTNIEDIRGSKVMPFQFLAAHDALLEMGGLPGAREVLGAVEKGCELALSNVPVLDGATLVALDISGSMQTEYTSRGREGGQNAAALGAMFATALMRTNPNCDLLMFSDSAAYANVSTTASFWHILRDLRGMHGGGTNFHAPFKKARRAYDRIIILSDMQGWVGGDSPSRSLKAYEAKFDVKPFVYSWDLVHTTTAQFPAPRIHCLAGISDKVFDVMRSLEMDRNALVSTIEAVTI